MDELTRRVAASLDKREVAFEEKKMFGGTCFMVDGKMCVGTNKGDLMVRLDPEIYDEVLKKKGCREMDFTGRPMKGFVFVDGNVLESQGELVYWVGLGLEFNPKARSSKKKAKGG